MLDLQSLNNAVFKSVSEHTKTETQDKIIGLLHLEYQTFINSAMILQGRSNEFSRKRPGERKEILANILDLSFYDDLEQQAKVNSESRKLESANLERDIQAMASRLEARPQLMQESVAMTEKLQNAEKAMQPLNSEIAELRKKKESLAARKDQAQLVQQQISGRRKDLLAWQARLADSVRLLGHFNAVIEKAGEIEEGYRAFKEASALEEALNEKLKKSLDMINRRNKLTELITSAQNTFNIERKTLSTRVSELESKINMLPQLQKNEAELQKRQQELELAEEAIENSKKSINDLKASIITASARISQLTDSTAETRQKIEMLSHAGATCPLCDSELGPEGCRRLVAKLNSELQQALSELKENTASVSSKKNELASLEKQTSQSEARFKSDRDIVSRQLAVIEKQVAETNLLAEELPVKKDALRTLEENLRNKNYAPDAQRSLAAVEQELQGPGVRCRPPFPGKRK